MIFGLSIQAWMSSIECQFPYRYKIATGIIPRGIAMDITISFSINKPILIKNDYTSKKNSGICKLSSKCTPTYSFLSEIGWFQVQGCIFKPSFSFRDTFHWPSIQPWFATKAIDKWQFPRKATSVQLKLMDRSMANYLKPVWEKWLFF